MQQSAGQVFGVCASPHCACGVRAGARLHHSGVKRIQRDDLAQQRRLLVRALRVLPNLGEVDHVRDDEQDGCA